MARIIAILGLSSLIVATNAMLLPRQNNATSIVYKFDGTDAWAENIAVRPNGQILITRMDNGELWNINPVTKEGILVRKFPASTLTGITEVRPDIYAVISGQLDTKNKSVDGSYEVWTVDMNAHHPDIVLAQGIPSAGNLNGITTVNNESVIVGDIAKGATICVALFGGKCPLTPVSDFVAMGPEADGPPYGIDGLKYKNGTLWFTNITKKTFNKITFDASGKIAGPIVNLQNNLQGDDFTFGSDSSIYMTTFDGKIMKLKSDGTGTPTLLANIEGSSACQFGRTASDKDVLYITSGKGFLYSLKI